MANAYDYTLRKVLRHQFATILFAMAMLVGTIYLFVTMPTGFIPSQDSGFLFGVTMAAQDISFESMAKHTHAIGEIVEQDPNVAGTGAIVPAGNQGFVFCQLKPRAQRALNVDEVMEELRPKLATIPGIMVFLQNPPPITISGQYTTSVYQMVLQSTDLQEIYAWVPRLMEKMRALPGFLDVNTDLQVSSPELMVDIDRDRATTLGITPEQIQTALYTSYGSRQVSTIFTPANEYAVIVEVEPQYQRSPEALSKLYLRSSSNTLVPLDSVVKVRRSVGPLSINHFGQLPAVTVSFNLKPGFSLGQAADQVNDVIRDLRMPATINTSFQGTVKEFQQLVPGLLMLLIVAILVIYIVLGILYESFIHPITILSGLPSAVFGALLTLTLFHKELDLYAFVGIDHAVRRGEEERHHDDRFRASRRSAQGASAARGHLAGLPAALPAHHDDHGGGAVRHAADRAGLRRRRATHASRWAWRWWAGCW